MSCDKTFVKGKCLDSVQWTLGEKQIFLRDENSFCLDYQQGYLMFEAEKMQLSLTSIWDLFFETL